MSNSIPFSEREGFAPALGYQIDKINSDTRIRIYNVVYDYFLRQPISNHYRHIEEQKTAYKDHFWSKFLSQPIDRYDKDVCHHIIRGTLIEDGPWYEVFRFIEFILDKCTGEYENHGLTSFYNSQRALHFVSEINRVMEEMRVGYRIINNQFSRITSKQETQEVENACNTPFDEASKQIKNALRLFSDREKPDYKNSIKESISAIESLVCEVTGERTFAAAMDKLGKYLKLHPAYVDALKNLYGFTSDVGGIRHGEKKGNLQVNEATARYMLVTCSAFVNYVISHPQIKSMT